MKITVGHLLLVAGLGTYVVLGPLRTSLQPQINAARTFAADKLPYLDFLRPERPSAVESPLVPVTAVPSAPVPAAPESEVPAPAAQDLATNVADKLPAEESASPATSVPDVTPAGPATADVAPPVTEAPKKHLVLRHRRRKRSLKPVAAPAEPVKRAPGKHGARKDPLVGTYVALTLATGNVVKGVLVERTATNYKVELPGMWPFD